MLDDSPPLYRVDFLAEWGRIKGQLEEWGILGTVNQGALEGICHLYASMNKAARNAESVELRQAFDGYRKALNEFGLTPASKGRVATGESKKPKSKAASYFGA